MVGVKHCVEGCDAIGEVGSSPIMPRSLLFFNKPLGYGGWPLNELKTAHHIGESHSGDCIGLQNRRLQTTVGSSPTSPAK